MALKIHHRTLRQEFIARLDLEQLGRLRERGVPLEREEQPRYLHEVAVENAILTNLVELFALLGLDYRNAASAPIRIIHELEYWQAEESFVHAYRVVAGQHTEADSSLVEYSEPLGAWLLQETDALLQALVKVFGDPACQSQLRIPLEEDDAIAKLCDIFPIFKPLRRCSPDQGPEAAALIEAYLKRLGVEPKAWREAPNPVTLDAGMPPDVTVLDFDLGSGEFTHVAGRRRQEFRTETPVRVVALPDGSFRVAVLSTDLDNRLTVSLLEGHPHAALEDVAFRRPSRVDMKWSFLARVPRDEGENIRRVLALRKIADGGLELLTESFSPKGESEVHSRESRDGGKTWSARKTLEGRGLKELTDKYRSPTTYRSEPWGHYAMRVDCSSAAQGFDLEVSSDGGQTFRSIEFEWPEPFFYWTPKFEDFAVGPEGVGVTIAEMPEPHGVTLTPHHRIRPMAFDLRSGIGTIDFGDKDLHLISSDERESKILDLARSPDGALWIAGARSNERWPVMMLLRLSGDASGRLEAVEVCQGTESQEQIEIEYLITRTDKNQESIWIGAQSYMEYVHPIIRWCSALDGPWQEVAVPMEKPQKNHWLRGFGRSAEGDVLLLIEDEEGFPRLFATSAGTDIREVYRSDREDLFSEGALFCETSDGSGGRVFVGLGEAQSESNDSSGGQWMTRLLLQESTQSPWRVVDIDLFDARQLEMIGVSFVQPATGGGFWIAASAWPTARSPLSRGAVGSVLLRVSASGHLVEHWVHPHEILAVIEESEGLLVAELRSHQHLGKRIGISRLRRDGSTWIAKAICETRIENGTISDIRAIPRGTEGFTFLFSSEPRTPWFKRNR